MRGRQEQVGVGGGGVTLELKKKIFMGFGEQLST